LNDIYFPLGENWSLQVVHKVFRIVVLEPQLLDRVEEGQ